MNADDRIQRNEVETGTRPPSGAAGAGLGKAERRAGSGAIGRRSFLGGALAWAAAGPVALTRGGERCGAGPYVDVHVHLGQAWNERGELTAEQLLRWMDANNIGQAFVLPLVSPEAWFYPISTDFVLQQTAPHRDRLFPFCAIDPRTVVMGKETIPDLLRRYRDAGAVGFGEHKWGGAIDDPRNIDLLGACSELELPVLAHLDNSRNTDAPGLPGLERLLQAAPELTFIGHGPGWWASISAAVTQAEMDGYPKGGVAPGGALDRLLAAYPRLYADLSAGSGHNAIQRDLEFGRQFLTRHSRQVLFGSDYLAQDQRVPQFDLFEQLDLDDAVEEAIFRGNALRLMGREAP